jgi:CheY-like chemotaxis protein
MPSGGTVTVSARNLQVDEGSLSPFPSGNYIVISIKDTGPGMEPELIDRIFDPFFTTKQNGTGLGLFSVHNIIRNHGGAIDITSEPGSGTLFTIYLPATGRFTETEGEGSAPAEGSGVSTAEPVSSRGRILLMDDEELVSRAAKRLLSRMGYEVDIADCSSGAVELFRRCLSSGGKYDAVILDLTIPGGPGGVDTLRLLKEIDPGVRCIVSSGYSVDPVMISWSENGFEGAVVKPYSLEDLACVLKVAAGNF